LGESVASIQAQMRVELQQLLRSHWEQMTPNARATFPQQTLYLSPGDAGITSMREQHEHWLQILMTVTGFVLLIVCANVANLMLVRGMERRQETSLSVALGARPSRLARQALTESVLLSLLGGVAGLAVAFAGTRLILHLAFPDIPGTAAVPISPSPPSRCSRSLSWSRLSPELSSALLLPGCPPTPIPSKRCAV
jgi:ABC-type antimicrobial peptide transport system permease subunit